MKFSFDLLDMQECELALKLISITHPSMVQEQPQPDTVAVEQVQPDTVAVEQVQEELAPTYDEQAGQNVDKNGTPWLEAVHSGNKRMTAKGVWQKKRGVDDDVLKAAEAAARAKIAGTPEPAPVEELQAPTNGAVPPAAVISMEDVGTAWTTALNAGVVSIESAMGIYQSLGIDPATMPTNETARASFVQHLNGLMHQPTTAVPGIG